MAEPLLVFVGEVQCTVHPAVPGLTLSGRSAAHPATRTQLAFSAPAPAGLPATLMDARIEASAQGAWYIRSGAREWQIPPCAVHLHREIGREFWAALPPRPAPAAKRLFWRAVLTLARSGVGLGLLRALRG
jgi:hypothetical protein